MPNYFALNEPRDLKLTETRIQCESLSIYFLSITVGRFTLGRVTASLSFYNMSLDPLALDTWLFSNMLVNPHSVFSSLSCVQSITLFSVQFFILCSVHNFIQCSVPLSCVQSITLFSVQCLYPVFSQ